MKKTYKKNNTLNHFASPFPVYKDNLTYIYIVNFHVQMYITKYYGT